MPNTLVVFLGHGIPGVALLLWGLSSLICLHLMSSSCKNAQLRRLLARVEFYIVFLGSAASILYHYALSMLMPAVFRSYQTLEHITILLPFLFYAAVGITTTSIKSSSSRLHFSQGFLNLLAALAFCQELLLFHFHSSDHQGVEGHYHLLLQLAVAGCILSTLVDIVSPLNVLVVLWKCMSIMLQGTWLLQMSFLLIFPSLLPQGCEVHVLHIHQKIQCNHDNLVSDAKALGTLRFSWHLLFLMIGSTIVCVLLARDPKEYSAIISTHDASDQEM